MAARKRGAKPPVCQRYELAAAIGGVMLVVVIAVLSTWAHHSLSAARPTAPKIAAALPAGAPSPTPTPSPPLRAQLRAWLEEANPSINALATAGDNVVSIGPHGGIAATGAACEKLAGALAYAQQHLPSPDPALTTALQRAFSDYEAGIRHCVSGTQRQDAVDIGQGAGFISQGNLELQKAFDVVEVDLSSGSEVLTV
jgi:hypothetical protein